MSMLRFVNVGKLLVAYCGQEEWVLKYVIFSSFQSLSPEILDSVQMILSYWNTNYNTWYRVLTLLKLHSLFVRKILGFTVYSTEDFTVRFHYGFFIDSPFAVSARQNTTGPFIKKWETMFWKLLVWPRAVLPTNISQNLTVFYRINTKLNYVDRLSRPPLAPFLLGPLAGLIKSDSGGFHQPEIRRLRIWYHKSDPTLNNSSCRQGGTICDTIDTRDMFRISMKSDVSGSERVVSVQLGKIYYFFS